MIKLAQRLSLAAIVVVTSMLWIEPAAQRLVGGQVGQAKATLAQRYPLRARSKNFYNRSKISYTRGK